MACVFLFPKDTVLHFFAHIEIEHCFRHVNIGVGK